MATTTAPAPKAEPAPSRPDGVIASGLREAGELATFGAQSAAALPGSLAYFSEALRHAAMMITGTIALVFAMSVFQGASIANLAYFLLRGLGAGDFFGLLTGYVIPRQTATTMFGYIFAAKICCGMCAQLGAMRIQQEVDALDSTGVDPRRYLIGTRLLAVAMFVPVAAIVAYFGNLAGSYLISVTLSKGLTSETLLSLHWAVQTPRDLLFTTFTMMTIALITATVACFYGLRTSGGPAEVGSSVARSLIVNLVVLHVIAVLFAVIVYGTAQNLPIGG